MDKRLRDALLRSNTRITRLSNYLTQKVCFTFAISFFSTTGAASTILAIIFLWATSPYNNTGDFSRDLIVLMILAILLASAHNFLYGFGRLWGKRWELSALRVLNDQVKEYRIPAEIDTATLRKINFLLEKLPWMNCRMTLFTSLSALTIGVMQSYIFSVEALHALYVLQAGIIAVTNYVIFTYLITERVTAHLRREARMLLADRNAWQNTHHSSTLMVKFTFIIVQLFTSVIITHGISTSTVLHSPFQVIILFLFLNVVVGVFMCNLIFISTLDTLREIELTAIQLSDQHRAQFISSSIDREFIDTARGMYRAGQKIVKYRNDLNKLNLTLEEKVRERTQQIELLSRTDPLTGCFNRGYLIEKLPQEIKKALRYQRPLSLIMGDLDHFKTVNDTYGHQAGDSVLKEFVQCIIGACRNDIDWVARYGGEEFVVILPETDIQGAQAMAERIRKTIADTSITFGSQKINVTVSCGLTGFDATTFPEQISTENLIRKADECLYRAKEEGRNRVVTCRL